jgi:hypothetical protein
VVLYKQYFKTCGHLAHRQDNKHTHLRELTHGLHHRGFPLFVLSLLRAVVDHQKMVVHIKGQAVAVVH